MEVIKQELLSFYKELEFVEDTHTYTVGGKRLPSVSGLISKYYPKFNADAIAEKKGKREGIDPEVLKAQWKKAGDDACALGHEAHLFGEFYPFDRSLKPKTGFDQAIKNFWDSLPPHIKPVTMELRMFHKQFSYAGTTDILVYNTEKEEFIMMDYKTNKDLFKNFAGQKMLGPFKNFLDTPYNHYQLQLSYYQILFEQTGYEIAKRYIIWIKPDGTYELYSTEDYTDILIKELKNK